MKLKHLYCFWRVARHGSVVRATDAPAVKPAFEYANETITHAAELDRGLAELALYRIDLVISDTPTPSNVDVKAGSTLNWWISVSSTSVFDYIC